LINPTEADVILAAIASAKLDHHGPTVGIVQVFYPAIPGQAAAVDVLPVVQRQIPTDDGSTEPEPLPVLPNVPLIYPRGGGCSITWALAPGDAVLLIVLWLDVTQWRLTGAPVVSPIVDQGSHHIAHTVAIPGILADVSLPIPYPLGEITVDGPSIKLGANATDAVANAAKVNAQLSAIQTTLGSLTGGGAHFTTPYTAGTVDCDKVKGE